MDQKIPKSTTDPISYIKGTYNVNLFLKPTDKEEIAKTITNLKDGSPGEDGIPSKIYKVSKPFISNTLAFLVNLSLSQGIFPSELKHATIVPLFKSGEENKFNNYRPVSLLLTVSKVFEKIFCLRLLDFLKKQR